MRKPLASVHCVKPDRLVCAEGIKHPCRSVYLFQMLTLVEIPIDGRSLHQVGMGAVTDDLTLFEDQNAVGQA